ncbi:hypothetical protein Scep_024670 [Stephania cephalantha]|uniref:Uncharacterized protein n=1 Tax=Stephania cephalantha TaxID=152367 RepID=A0AAP0EZS3_9MAGN
MVASAMEAESGQGGDGRGVSPAINSTGVDTGDKLATKDPVDLDSGIDYGVVKCVVRNVHNEGDNGVGNQANDGAPSRQTEVASTTWRPSRWLGTDAMLHRRGQEQQHVVEKMTNIGGRRSAYLLVEEELADGSDDSDEASIFFSRVHSRRKEKKRERKRRSG